MQSNSVLKFTPFLKIIYSLTLGGVVAFYLYIYLLYCVGSFGGTGDTVFSVFLRQLNGLFAFTALPLAIFTIAFLTKGGGLEFFRSWNIGKRLALSSLAIIVGYILVVFSPNTSIERGYSPNYYDYYYTYFGLISIAAGFFSILVFKKRISSGEKTSSHRIKWKSRKIFLIFSVLIIFSILIGGYLWKLQLEIEHLEDNYQHLKEGFPFLVNDNWTDNEGIDSNYINYKGAIFNSGLNIKSNVTLLVNIRDVDGNWLERAEIPIGDINGWDEKAFDINVEYSGEMAEVLTSYKWDNINSIHN
jgi:hypothetical protein